MFVANQNVKTTRTQHCRNLNQCNLLGLWHLDWWAPHWHRFCLMRLNAHSFQGLSFESPTVETHSDSVMLASEKPNAQQMQFPKGLFCSPPKKALKTQQVDAPQPYLLSASPRSFTVNVSTSKLWIPATASYSLTSIPTSRNASIAEPPSPSAKSPLRRQNSRITRKS